LQYSWEIPEGGSTSSSTDITSALFEMKGHKSKIDLLTFHPAIEVLTSVAGDNEIKLWDLNTTSEILSVPGWKGQAIQSASWSNEGRLLATACRDRKLRVYDPRAGPDPTHVCGTRSGIAHGGDDGDDE
jgi:WD40 repeat protein